MKRIEKFEIPAHLFLEFTVEAMEYGFSVKSKISSNPDFYLVSIVYDEEFEQEEIDELHDFIFGLEEEDTMSEIEH